jgi:DNA polymerase-4
MPTVRALALCPEAIVMPPRHRLYSDYSRQVMEILRQTAPVVQQVSIDEAFMDLTDVLMEWDQAVEVARQLQTRVREQVGLSASLGIAANKLVAKVASDREKPGGLTVVRPGEEASFLSPLPVRVLWGIGPVTAQKLAAMDVTTVGELASVPEQVLRTRFGRNGTAMARQARGIDSQPVVTGRDPKSVSQERTFGRDLAEEEALHEHLRKLSQGVGLRLTKAGLSAGTVAVKLRYADFTTLTRQMTLDVPTDDDEIIYQAALVLLRRAWRRGRPVRLLGVAGRHLSSSVGQLSLW